MNNKKVITPFTKPCIASDVWDNLKLLSIVRTATDDKDRYYLIEFEADLICNDNIYSPYGGRAVWDNIEKVFYNYRLTGDLPHTKSFTSSLGISYYLDILDGYIPESLIRYINEYVKENDLKTYIERMIVDGML